MSKANDIHVTPHSPDDTRTCRLVWRAVRHFLGRLGHERMPRFVKSAIAVTEAPGRVSLRSDPVHGNAKTCGDTFNVLSANLWHDFPRYKNIEKRLEAFAQLIEQEDVDLLLLQEVARTPRLKADMWLAERLHMAYVYTRANGSEKIGFEEGLSIFSRFPLKRLPYLRQVGSHCNPFVRRMALGAEIDTPCGELLAFSTHLALPRKQNALQLGELQHWVDSVSEGRAAIIGGDFNAPEHTPQIQHVRNRWQDTYRTIHEHGDAVTHEVHWPWGGALMSHRLDYIFLQAGQPAWQVVDVHHVDAPGGPHSDHRAVLACLTPVH